MAYCRQCGAQIPDNAAFCPACGAKNGEARQDYGQQQNQYQYNNQYQSYGQARQPNDVEDNKGISILCYFGILFLIPYLARQDSPFVKFHSNQGLVLLIFSLIAWAASKVPFIGWIIGIICAVFTFVCFIMGIVNVCNGDMKELPVIGKIEILK